MDVAAWIEGEGFGVFDNIILCPFYIVLLYHRTNEFQGPMRKLIFGTSQ
jgi:hypothetical protein